MEPVEKRIATLEDEVCQLKRMVELLLAENAVLRGRLAMDSHNSHKPPSTDGLQKKTRIPNQRKKGGKSPGGQKGHQGNTLKMVESPDLVVDHLHSECQECGSGLTVNRRDYKSRQVFDLPEIRLRVTEHRSYRQVCQRCGRQHSGAFPASVTNPTQYGERLKALCVYLSAYQFLPYARLREMIGDLCGHQISEATICNFNKNLSAKLETEFLPIVKASLLKSVLLHTDETGMRGLGKTNWVHVLGNRELTYYLHHQTRGRAAINEMGVLPYYRGTLIHDRFRSYLGFDRITHGFCNAHLVRELIFHSEEENLDWAGKLLKLLLLAKARKDDGKLNDAYVKITFNKFKNIIRPHMRELRKREVRIPRKRKGNPKRTRAENLIVSLTKNLDKFLLFLSHPVAPFDNNLAERDLRMIKVKQKISGCFRSENGARAFCMIRSYLSTLRKNQQPILLNIRKATQGNPFLPIIPE